MTQPNGNVTDDQLKQVRANRQPRDAAQPLSESIPSPTGISRLSEISRESLAAERQAAAAEDHERRRKAMLKASGRPRRHVQAALDECGDPVRYERWQGHYRRLWEALGDGFLFALVGNRGSGKTQMGVQLISAAINHRGLCGHYTTALDVFLALRSGYGRNDGPTEFNTVERYAAHALLVIDEVAVRGHSEWEDRVLTALIDRRYRDKVDTLLISNETPSEFVRNIGPSVKDRLYEAGGVLECNWESFRRGKNQNRA